MGYIKHNAIVVTSWDGLQLRIAWKMATQIFGSLTSEIIPYAVNSGGSFFIAPDGSKEGWRDSDIYDEKRKKFQDWFLTHENFCDYIEVEFGGDSDYSRICRTKDIDLAKE